MATIFLTPGWDDPSQDVHSTSSRLGEHPSSVDVTEAGTIPPGSTPKMGQVALSFVADGSSQPRTAGIQQTTASPSGPSLNPSIGTMAGGKGEPASNPVSHAIPESQSSEMKQHGSSHSSTNPVTVYLNNPSATEMTHAGSVAEEPEQSALGTQAQQNGLEPLPTRTNGGPLSAEIVPTTAPAAGIHASPLDDAPVGTPLWAGPLPLSWDPGSSQHLQPLVPLPGL